MLKRFFITGTDTSVGKTVVSRALLQALASGGKSVAGYKPVAKGSKETAEGMRNKDALVLQSVSSLELPYEAINPIALSEEESSVAHSCPINYTLLSNGLASLSDKVDHVVVEGTGGWRSLMNDLRPLSEWVVQEQLPVLMVVGIQEGCINHALLTAQAVANDGLPLIGWVANRINPGLAHYAEIIDVLGKKLPAPLIGELPYPITTKPGAVRLSVTTAPRLLRGGFQERRTGRFMFIQILLLEDTHADGVTVFAVNEELMNQLAFYSKPEFTVDVNRFFILFIDDQIQFIEIEYGKSVIHRQFGRA